MPISVLILTLNEEQNIAGCMQSLTWSDDIVVLDSFSTDASCEIARQHGARVHERAFDDFASQRNFALDNIEFKHKWVLHLDADEVVTPELCEELSRAVCDQSFHAYKIASRLMFMGKWLRFSGMYPAYQVRLGHIDHLRFEQVGHGQREKLLSGEIGTLKEPYIHNFFSKGITDWIERHNRYATDEALRGMESSRAAWVDLKRVLVGANKTERRRAAKNIASSLPFRPFLRFIYMYFLRLGFLDGRAGFTYCRLLAIYEYWIVLKMRELRRR